jgi:hypothetical protein
MGAPDDNDRPSKGLEDLTVSELTLAIEETILTKEDKRIARLRFVELETIERIAETMMLDKRTVQKRLIRIFPRVVWTVQKLLR